MSHASSLAYTPLHDWHVTHGGKLTDFAGWSMPTHYTSIADEHLATRQNVALFDVSHMGRLFFRGGDALPFLQRLLTRDVAKLAIGKVRYSLIVDHAGQILDDVLVSRLPNQEGHPAFGLVVNASNRAKILAWMETLQNDFTDLSIQDQTEQTAMIAVQGPQAVDLVAQVLSPQVASLGNYQTGTLAWADPSGRFGRDGFVSRTGYTGEDGFELIVDAELGTPLWEALLAAHPDSPPIPAGLAARDTLRLEAAMPLYGHELSETIDPYTAGLGFAVQLEKPGFVGREALTALKDKTTHVRIGLKMEGRRVPRQHYDILAEDQVVGSITSGTFSPTLQQPIAMGYVLSPFSAAATELQIDIRGNWLPATVVSLPFLPPR